MGIIEFICSGGHDTRQSVYIDQVMYFNSNLAQINL